MKVFNLRHTHLVWAHDQSGLIEQPAGRVREERLNPIETRVSIGLSPVCILDKVPRS